MLKSVLLSKSIYRMILHFIFLFLKGWFFFRHFFYYYWLDSSIILVIWFIIFQGRIKRNQIALLDSSCPCLFLVGHRMTKNGLGRNNCSLWIVICILLHCFASIFCVIFSCIHWQGYLQGCTMCHFLILLKFCLCVLQKA